MGSNKRLTAKQEKFVQELIKGKSQRQAYKAAYDTRATDKTIDEAASALLATNKVAARYEALHNRLIREAEDESIITAKDLLRELAYIAKSNGSAVATVTTMEMPELDGDGNPTGKTRVCKVVDTPTTDSLSQDQKATIAGIEQTATGVKVKQYDKLRAIELLGRHLGMFVDKAEVKVSGTVTVEELIREVEGTDY